jgi:hypothetical protein
MTSGKTASAAMDAGRVTGARHTTPSGGADPREHRQPARRPPPHYSDEQLKRFTEILGDEAAKVDRRIQSTNDIVEALVVAFGMMNGRLKRLEQQELKKRRLDSYFRS